MIARAGERERERETLIQREREGKGEIVCLYVCFEAAAESKQTLACWNFSLKHEPQRKRQRTMGSERGKRERGIPSERERQQQGGKGDGWRDTGKDRSHAVAA